MTPLIPFAANGVAACGAQLPWPGAGWEQGRTGPSPECWWHSPLQWALLSPTSLAPSTLLPSRAEKFYPEGWDQPVGLQGEGERQSLGLEQFPCSSMLVQHKPWWCRERQRCGKEHCHAPVVPLHTLPRLDCVQQGTSGLPPCLPQGANEVPDCCALCAKVQQAEKLFPSPFLLSQAASYGETAWGLPRKAIVQSALEDNLRGACGQQSLAASKGGDSS